MTASIEARRKRGHALAAQGRWLEAAADFTAVAGERPSHAPAYNNLGVCHMELGELDRAADCFAKALELDAGYARAADNLGVARKQQGRLVDALACHEQALRLEPRLLDGATHRASVLQALGRIDEAGEAFETVLEVQPQNISARIGLAELHDWRGDIATGLRMLEPILASGDPPLAAATVYARLRRQRGDGAGAIESLEAALKRGGSVDDRRQAHFTLGGLYDDSGDYSRAFGHFRSGNDLRRAGFDPDAHTRYVDAIVETFGAGRFPALHRAGNDNDRPVFIVGMPRSGTSLVEQILAAHPRVHGGGELAAIGEIAQRLGAGSAQYPATLRDAAADVLSSYAADYLAKIAALDPAAPRVTDKMPLNFLHVGLIALLFPRGRVIHVHREPLDTGLSCYFQNFIDPALAFTFDLGHIGRYLADYERLMHHWDTLAPLRMLHVSYESLVAEPRATSEKMVAFLDLAWTDACLAFHASGRFVNTASYSQVRRPVYTAAIARHRHYDRYLQPMRDGLHGRE